MIMVSRSLLPPPLGRPHANCFPLQGTTSISNERPAERANSPSSASSPEHPGPSSDAIASLPVAEREVVRFMEKLRTMGKLEGLQTQLNTFNMIGNIISDNEAEAEAEPGDERYARRRFFHRSNC